MINKKLNIAIFHLAFIYSGGGEKLVLIEAQGLKKLGHKVTVFTCVYDREKCFADLTKNIKIYEFLPFLGKIFKAHEALRVIITSILAPIFIYKFRKYDCVFAANQPSLWIAFLVKLIFKVKYVGYLAQSTRFLYPRKIDKATGLYFGKKEYVSFSVQIMKVFRKLIKKLDQISIKGAEKILVNGEYMTELIKKVYKVDATNCPAGAKTISKPVKISIRKKGKVKINGYILDKPYILITNRHVWQKRFEYGLTSFLGLLAENCEFYLVISGSLTEYTKELKVMVKRMGLGKKVFFLGYVKDKDLEKLYKNAYIYLYTAPEEDYGMGVLEAMGSGIPVVAWNNGGPSKTILDGETGVLIDFEDIETFTKKLIYLAQDNKLIMKMGKNAILRVKENFSWNNHFIIVEQSLINLVN